MPGTNDKPSPVSPLAAQHGIRCAGPSVHRANVADAVARLVPADPKRLERLGRRDGGVVRKLIDLCRSPASIIRSPPAAHRCNAKQHCAVARVSPRLASSISRCRPRKERRAVPGRRSAGSANPVKMDNQPVGISVLHLSAAVSSGALRVPEVTAMRNTGCASASALGPIRGRLGAVGRLFAIRANRIARHRVAAHDIGIPPRGELQSHAGAPEGELDEIARHPRHPPHRPSIRCNLLIVRVSGGGARRNSVGDPR